MMIMLRIFWTAIVFACTSLPGISGQACNSSAPTRCGENCHCFYPQYCGTDDCTTSGCNRGWNPQDASCQTRCADGRFGYNCGFNCKCNDTNEICNKSTGACTSGCLADHYDIHCQTKCSPSAPTKCESECHCLNDGFCGSISCNGQCDLGWTGTQCQTPVPTTCDAGKYGPACQHVCNCQNFQSAACHQTSAACSGPCKVGYWGTYCQSYCICPNRQSYTCYRYSGECTAQCNKGFTGPSCQPECSPSAPTKCGSECHCLNDGFCGSISCYAQCDPGWTGTQCQTPVPATCDAGKYGPTCQHMCNCQNFQSAACNKTTGACSGPCKNGLYRLTCDLTCDCNNYQSIACHQTSAACSGPCKDGYWGTNCQSYCNCPNRQSYTCYRYSGMCTALCNTGFTGPNCQPVTTAPTTCPVGQFGSNCEKTCNCERRQSTACAKTSGWCTAGCITGFWGQNCDRACNCERRQSTACAKTSGSCTAGCSTGYWGPSCQACNCANRTTRACDRNTGVCTSPCNNGINTPNCQKECDMGKYGPYCEKFCSCPRRKSAVCDRTTGSCTDVCIPGFWGADCRSACYCENRQTLACNRTTGSCTAAECNTGYWNTTCNRTCDCPNRVTSACHIDTGVCSASCSDGFTGPNCDTAATQATKTTDPPTGAGLTGPVMGAIIGGAVLAVVVVVVVIIVLVRRRRRVPAPAPGNTEVAKPIVTEKKPKVKQRLQKDIKLLELVDIVQSLDADPEFLDDEFKTLSGGVAMSCDTAYLPQHVHKCRYKGMVPYDHSRVVLEPSDSDPYSDFINASYIDGFSVEKKYVAAQGTTTFIMNDFWRMIWQLNADVIIMLTQLKEDNKVKCDQYWPEDVSIAYGHITVELLVTHQFDDFSVRTLTVRAEGKVRTIKQFHFTHWGDHDAPDDTSGIISLLSRVQEAKDEAKGPIIVHCSAGVGRTGTYIALEMLLEEGSSKGVVDIPKCVTTIRKQRANMIQTPAQYAFLHRALRDAWVGADSILTPPEFALKAGTYFHAIPPSNKSKAETEFEGLHYLRKMLGPDDYKDARNSKNQDKNRDDDNLPPDSSRLFLSTYIPGRTDYINAVYLPGYKSKSTYVSTQTPLTDTMIDFWRLLHGQRASTILMLNTDEVDNDCRYWPGDDESLKLGPFEVYHQGTETNGDMLQRQFGLIYTKSDEEAPQVVRQFCMNMWNPSENVPNSVESVLTLLKSVTEWQRQHGNPPIIVHCRNGVDRTVLLCACFSVIEKLTAEQIISVMYTVKTMRKHRPGAVATLDQYQFIYRVVRRYMDTFSTYSNFTDIESGES